jgi:hypothetical protein
MFCGRLLYGFIRKNKSFRNKKKWNEENIPELFSIPLFQWSIPTAATRHAWSASNSCISNINFNPKSIADIDITDVKKPVAWFATQLDNTQHNDTTRIRHVSFDFRLTK